MIKYTLHNEIINSSVKCFIRKLWPNDSYRLLKGQNCTLFSKSFWDGSFFLNLKIFMVSEHSLKTFTMDFMVFSLRIPSVIHHNR